MRIGFSTVVLCLLAVPCVGQQAGATRLLDVEFTEVFWIGDEDGEVEFGDVREVHFAPDGRHVIVLDGLNHQVGVFQLSGAQVASWGRQGAGPGEFRRAPRNMAVSSEGLIAVDNGGRADVFDMSGALLETRSYGGRSGVAIMFDGRGRLLLQTVSAFENAPFRLTRIADGEVLWTSRNISTMTTFNLHGTVPVIGAIGGGRIVVGHNDNYDFAVLDATTGDELNRFGREVGPARTVPEGHKARIRERLAQRRGRPARTPLTFGDTFPLIAAVLAGPGGAVWVRRHIGVGDELAPPIAQMEAEGFQMYDLFSPASGNYLGTVDVPEGFGLRAGNDTHVAGIHTDELGRQSVRVLRVQLRNLPEAE